MEIKCQLDAKDDIYCRFYCLLNTFRGTIMPIIRSSRLLYRWSLPVVFGALVFKLSVFCGAEGYVSDLQAARCTVRITSNLYLKVFFHIIAYLIQNTRYFNCKEGYDGRSYKRADLHVTSFVFVRFEIKSETVYRF